MRATNVPSRVKAKKKLMRAVAGMHAGPGTMYRRALEAHKRSEQQAFIGRKLKKRQYRQLWITRINIATRAAGMPYSRFMAGLLAADVRLDRKQLSELAIHQPEAFQALVEQARAALA